MQEMLKQQAEKYLAKYPKIFFCHVPKCAGVSLSKAIYASVYPSVLKGTKFASHIDLKSSRVSAELLGIEMMTARESQLISHLDNPHMLYTNGHCIARPSVVSKYYKDWHFLTILRDPIDRYISEYVYNRFKQSEWLKNDTDIEEYLTTPTGISAGMTYAKYFSGMTVEQILADKQSAIDASVANLRQFAVAGTLDDMDGWKQKFDATFNTNIKVASKNKSPNQDASVNILNNPALMEQIRTLCEVDIAIYDQVKSVSKAA